MLSILRFFPVSFQLVLLQSKICLVAKFLNNPDSTGNLCDLATPLEKVCWIEREVAPRVSNHCKS